MNHEIFFKLTRPDGWDFYTGKTINYRENIGKTVRRRHRGKAELCSETVLHASRNPNDAFVGVQTPCAVFEVTGTPVVEDDQKCGFKQLRIIRERKPEDVFEWDYKLAYNPVNSFSIPPPERITEEHIALLQQWASVGYSVWSSVGYSVRASVWASVWASVGYLVRDSVWTSVGASVRASVWASVWASVGYSVRASVGDSVWTSVGYSVRASVWALIGYIFRNCITNWHYTDHKHGEYPFQPAVDLWNMGLIPSYDGKRWRLHGGKDAEVLWEEEL